MAIEPFKVLRSKAIAFSMDNVDTDRIKPARFGLPTGANYAQFMFADQRFAPDGTVLPDSPFDRPELAGARILVGKSNFGCGSSRESAVWCLRDYGFRSVIAASFGDIFFGNCFNNGLLPIVLSAAAVQQLHDELLASPTGELQVDLEQQQVRSLSGATFSFDIDAFKKECMLEGLDDRAMTMRFADAITAYEARLATERPWIDRKP